MRMLLRFRILSLLAVGLALGVSLGMVGARWVTTHAAGVSPAQTSLAHCPTVVKVVSSPNLGSRFNDLRGIATLSTSNIWADGSFQNTGGPFQTLIEHWNGSTWSVVPSPNPGSSDNELFGIEAVSASNIWAVGEFANTGGPNQTLIEHWNGSTWSVVPSPSPGSSDSFLEGIESVSASNIWAVGFFQNTGGPVQTLIEQWNGSTWSVVPSPNPGSSLDELFGIETLSASNIWAVGDYDPIVSPRQTLIEHWNGSTWSVVSSPSPASSGNFLDGIESVSASNIWAVGSFQNTGGPFQTLIEHWNGSSWSVVSSPSPGSSDNALDGIEAVSASNIWAVGSFQNTGGPNLTLIEHWNGSTWSVVSSPSPGSFDNFLNGVQATAGNLWAVGSFENTGGPLQTLTEHGCAG